MTIFLKAYRNLTGREIIMLDLNKAVKIVWSMTLNLPRVSHSIRIIGLIATFQIMTAM